jgi:Cu/Ag efflux protein CusF
MKKTLLKLAAITLLVGFVAGPVQAQDKKEDKPAAAGEDKKAAPKGVPGHGKVTAVDEAAKTITIGGKKDRTFNVTSKTHILKSGKPATLADAKVGDEVGVYYASEEKDGKHDLITLNVGPKPEGKGTKAEHKKKE